MTLERKLPKNVSYSAQTDVFTAKSIPDKFVKHHNLKAGTWGVLTVKSGSVRYYLEDSKEPLATIFAGEEHIIIPQESHYVRLSDDAEFFVAFHK